MCGIVGWIDWEKNLSDSGPIIERMAEVLANRGPDDKGVWLSNEAALGHRRLIVVDPQGGKQPMTRTKGAQQYTVVYNGELYNTQELRRDLVQSGCEFYGHSDTEVLLNAYIEWGDRCVERFNGIYAFAIWNSQQKNLFLARDRMGVKPLFYAQYGSSFIFASELKALLTHPDVEPVLDREGLAEVFALGPGRTPGHGVFRGIKELRPGRCMTYDKRGIRMRRYWSLESKRHTDDVETTAQKIRDLFCDTISRQLIADVPVCTLLSGGLDSSAITALAAKNFENRGMIPLKTFSIDYVDNEKFFKPNDFQPNSDTPWIKKVSDFAATEHHYVTVDTPQLVEALYGAAEARDLPGMADVDSSLYLFCKEIKKEVTVALSGECADEVFGGYPWYHREDMLTASTFPWARNTEVRRQLLAPELLRTISVDEYLRARYEETLAEVPRLPGEDPMEERRREMFYLNLNWFMATLLDRKDRMSMAAGLEVRVPFCDHRLVEYVWNIPWEIKNYRNREKGILRKALSGLLPEDVLWRKKSPYPKTHNPTYLAAVKKIFMDIVHDSQSPLMPLLNREFVQRLLSADGSFLDKPWYGQLMTGPQLLAYLIQVNAWLSGYNIQIRI